MEILQGTFRRLPLRFKITPERKSKKTLPCSGLIAASGTDRSSIGSTVPSTGRRVLHRPSASLGHWRGRRMIVSGPRDCHASTRKPCAAVHANSKPHQAEQTNAEQE